jgi:hypothetical protein
MAGNAVAVSAGRPPEAREPRPAPIELSGILRRPIKWTPQLELVPAGQTKRFDVQGDLLKEVKEGTPIRVKGIARSRLHRGGTKHNPSPFPAQWVIWLEVTEVRVLKDAWDVLGAGSKAKP